MLRAVGITRPVDQHERLVAGLEYRQHDLGGDVNEVGLLLDIGDGGAGRLEIADLGIFACDGGVSGRPAARNADLTSSDNEMPDGLPVASSNRIVCSPFCSV